jgi:hypothetical protein
VSLSELNAASIAASNSGTSTKDRVSKTVSPAIKVACVKHGMIHGVPSALRAFKNRYPKLEFSETSIRRWKKIYEKAKTLEDSVGSDPKPSIFQDHRGRPNTMKDNLLVKVTEIILGSRTAGLAICRKDVISIGTSILAINCPHILVENGGPVGIFQLKLSWWYLADHLMER